jgi:hypothetical protein
MVPSKNILAAEFGGFDRFAPHECGLRSRVEQPEIIHRLSTLAFDRGT